MNFTQHNLIYMMYTVCSRGMSCNFLLSFCCLSTLCSGQTVEVSIEPWEVIGIKYSNSCGFSLGPLHCSSDSLTCNKMHNYYGNVLL